MQRYNMLVAGQLTPKLGEWQQPSAAMILPAGVDVVVTVLVISAVVGSFLMAERYLRLDCRTLSHPSRKPF